MIPNPGLIHQLSTLTGKGLFETEGRKIGKSGRKDREVGKHVQDGQPDRIDHRYNQIGQEERFHPEQRQTPDAIDVILPTILSGYDIVFGGSDKYRGV